MVIGVENLPQDEHFMQQNRRISVIIPLYNKGKYIARALDSVFSQTYQDYEVIVVDDGSTDTGPQIVQKYKDPRLRMIRQKNAGPGTAKNHGIHEAKGEYVAFLDADDEWLPEFLRIAYNALQKYPDCDLCVTSFYYGAVGGRIGCQYDEGVWTLPEDLNPLEFKDHLDSLHSAGAILCTRQLVEKFEGFYENGCTYGEDAYLWLKAILNCRIYRLSKPYFVYHTEASEIGVYGGRKFFPPKPFLLEPDTVRTVCPKKYTAMLERFLSYWALVAYHNCLGVGREGMCKNFLSNFPLMKQADFLRYYLLQAKLRLLLLYRFFKKVAGKCHL